jgi:hypothetical protein
MSPSPMNVMVARALAVCSSRAMASVERWSADRVMTVLCGYGVLPRLL